MVPESCCSSVTGVLCPLQVVLPMLNSAVVETGWISEADFLTGIVVNSQCTFDMSINDFTQTVHDFGFHHLIDVGLVACNQVEWTRE